MSGNCFLLYAETIAFFGFCGYNGGRNKKKGAIGIRYVYRPHHPWRHGYRREKWRRGFLLLVRILFVLEAAALAAGYIRAHTAVTVTERGVSGLSDGTGEAQEVYGIGIGTGDGSVFWFHSGSEILDSAPDSGKE